MLPPHERESLDEGAAPSVERSDGEMELTTTIEAVSPGAPIVRGLLFGVPISLALWALILWLFA